MAQHSIHITNFLSPLCSYKHCSKPLPKLLPSPTLTMKSPSTSFLCLPFDDLKIHSLVKDQNDLCEPGG